MTTIWKERRYHIESKYPIVAAAIATWLFYRFYLVLKNPVGLLGEIVESALVVCGTLLGFLLTITTIINAINTRRMQFIKAQGGYSTLMQYLRLAILLNIITVSIAIITPLLYAIHALEDYVAYCHAIQIFIISWTWIASIRFTIVFVRLLSDEKIN